MARPVFAKIERVSKGFMERVRVLSLEEGSLEGRGARAGVAPRNDRFESRVCTHDVETLPRV